MTRMEIGVLFFQRVARGTYSRNHRSRDGSTPNSRSRVVESIYRNALVRELYSKGLSLEIERDVPVAYKNHVVGRHRLDLVVERRVIVELKAASVIADVHLAQALSYMKATNMELSLIVNFGEPRLTWKRLIKTQK